MKPFLREKIPVNFEEIPDTTSFEAGYLVTKNAGWRNVRPVIDATAACQLPQPRGETAKSI